jgi:Na+-transporting methylmalonyl-CoA/oxaloacetate decarboxylase gamma subunit
VVLRLFAGLLLIGGGIYFVHGLQVQGVVSDALLLEPDGWKHQGFALTVAGGFVVVFVLLLVLWFETHSTSARNPQSLWHREVRSDLDDACAAKAVRPQVSSCKGNGLEQAPPPS